MDFFTPYDPEPSQPRVRRFRPVPFRLLAPNLVTVLALCVGLTAIRMALEGRIDLAVYGIVAAAALDGIDGRLARMLKGTSSFGAQLDSLADFVNFGVAPALLLYFWVLDGAGSFGWVASLTFAIAAALRLARFNAALDGPEEPAFAQNYFTGVPAPAGAIIVLLPVYLGHLGLPSLPRPELFAEIYCVAIALLMVSRLPTWSGKKAGKAIGREWVAPLFIGAAVAVGLLISYPWQVLTAITLAYLVGLPFGIQRYRQLDAAHRKATATAAAPAPTPPPPASAAGPGAGEGPAGSGGA